MIRLPESTDGVDYLTFNTQVPLAGKAIQLKVFGPKTEESELRSVNRSLLDNLNGKSSWSNREDRIGKAMVGVFKLVLVVGGIIGLVLFSTRKSRARQRDRQRRERDDRDRPRRPKRRRSDDED